VTCWHGHFDRRYLPVVLQRRQRPARPAVAAAGRSRARRGKNRRLFLFFGAGPKNRRLFFRGRSGRRGQGLLARTSLVTALPGTRLPPAGARHRPPGRVQLVNPATRRRPRWSWGSRGRPGRRTSARRTAWAGPGDAS
jgi:hypothetical protein